jgi:hypothetical protein
MGAVALIYNPSYFGDMGQEDIAVLGQPRQKVSQTPSQQT